MGAAAAGFFLGAFFAAYVVRAAWRAVLAVAAAAYDGVILLAVENVLAG
jgi:hypothetical protein